MESNDLDEIREVTKKNNGMDTAMSQACFSKYLTMLTSNPSSCNVGDITIINKLLGENVNILSDKAKLGQLFASYESLPLASQSEEVWSAIQKIYALSDAYLFFNSSLTLKQAIQTKSYVLAKV